MNKRVYGVLGISSIMANWNADFTGYPKTISNGTTFGSDKAFKYPMKKMWENEGKKVLYIKSMKFSEQKDGVALVPRSLKERYELLFNVDNLKDCKDSKQVAANLMTAIDVKNFGATFAEEKNNISITGAVQIGQGFNKYDDTTPEEQQILSPFRDGSKDNEETGEPKNSTLGTKIVSDEAHYFYPFTINPSAYKELIELGVTEGYTEDDYQDFKRTALVAATSYATNSKIGCENEFGLFVETEPNTYLPNLSSFIEFEKGENINIINIKCSNLINDLRDSIKKVEIYYNPDTTKIETEISNPDYYHIITRQPLS